MNKVTNCHHGSWHFTRLCLGLVLNFSLHFSGMISVDPPSANTSSSSSKSSRLTPVIFETGNESSLTMLPVWTEWNKSNVSVCQVNTFSLGSYTAGRNQNFQTAEKALKFKQFTRSLTRRRWKKSPIWGAFLKRCVPFSMDICGLEASQKE